MASTTSHAGERATYRDYCSWPDDGKRYEILDGEVVEMNAPIVPHQEAAYLLCQAIREPLIASGAGEAWVSPIDVIFADDTVLQPDVVAVRTERLSIVRTSGIFGAPEFVAEVLSPSTTTRDLFDKRSAYQRHGVHEYWIVDPIARALFQLALEAGVLTDIGRFEKDAEVESRAFPGLVVKLAAIWPRLRSPK